MTLLPTGEHRVDSMFVRNVVDTVVGVLVIIMIALGTWSLYTIDTLKDRVTVLESSTNVSTQLSYVSDSIKTMQKDIKSINTDVMQIKISLARRDGG